MRNFKIIFRHENNSWPYRAKNTNETIFFDKNKRWTISKCSRILCVPFTKIVIQLTGL